MTDTQSPAPAGTGAPPPFSSALSVPGFAACLDMGLRPVGLVQGFCVMQWAWYGSGSIFGMGVGQSQFQVPAGAYSRTFNCPHGYVSAEHRTFGSNYEQPWVEEAWAQGFGSAYSRMLDEAVSLGAHGVIGIVDRAMPLDETGVTEFHILGTAVVVDGAEPPPQPFTTYLAGQRLAKLLEAGFMPVAVATALASVRVWASCVTEILMGGQTTFGVNWGTSHEVNQISEAHAAVREIAREHVRRQLGSDTLHGCRLEMSGRSVDEGDQVIECTLRGTGVRRFRDAEPLEAPRPTVRLT